LDPERPIDQRCKAADLSAVRSPTTAGGMADQKPTMLLQIAKSMVDAPVLRTAL
jgi:hypothetical protein